MAVLRKRKLVAEFCRLLGEQVGDAAPAHGHGLAPRVRETLECLLAGESEKQTAARMRISPHTIHVYVKRLYRHYAVCSRGELLARFVRPRQSTKLFRGDAYAPSPSEQCSPKRPPTYVPEYHLFR
jgi:DNA-binding CsgD family transcriptional regulator